MRYLPTGSSITVKKNQFIQIKQADDTRNMYFEGMDIRYINGASQEITFNISDNYSSSSNETQQVDYGIFTSAAFSAKKNSAGAYDIYYPGVI